MLVPSVRVGERCKSYAKQAASYPEKGDGNRQYAVDVKTTTAIDWTCCSTVVTRSTIWVMIEDSD